jgi:hypothetical protein
MLGSGPPIPPSARRALWPSAGRAPLRDSDPGPRSRRQIASPGWRLATRTGSRWTLHGGGLPGLSARARRARPTAHLRHPPVAHRPTNCRPPRLCTGWPCTGDAPWRLPQGAGAQPRPAQGAGAVAADSPAVHTYPTPKKRPPDTAPKTRTRASCAVPREGSARLLETAARRASLATPRPSGAKQARNWAQLCK